jgi:hypothetical protein
MKDWQRIRLERIDITDYVIHFTRYRSSFDRKWSDRSPGFAQPEEVFKEILEDGFIRPTFAPIRSKTFGSTSNTVRGPYPAVCLTEQPLSAVLVTRRCAGSRYSGFGIAYHKYALFHAGGRPVLYGSKCMLGRRMKPDEPGYEEGKEIYTGGLPADLQYLWVRYEPAVGDSGDYPIDFTWEREWRVKCSGAGLPVYLDQYSGVFNPATPVCALVVEKDEQVAKVRSLLQAKMGQGVVWAGKLTRIVSLETVATKLKLGDQRYARIETWPT